MSLGAVVAGGIRQQHEKMKIALWIVQSLLAAAFLMAGAMKVTTPQAELVAQGMAWAAAVPAWVPPLAGVAEVLGALGLLLPSVTRIKPRLTVLAALGLVLVMLLAVGLHLALREGPQTLAPLVLGALAAFVAWGREKKAPISEKAQ